MLRLILALFLLASPAFADDVQGIFYNPTLHQFQGQTRANGMVGFQQGRTDGTVPCTGCVGETLTFTYSGGNVATTTGGTAVDVTSFSLPPGNWEILANFTGQVVSGASFALNGSMVGGILLTDNSNTVLQRSMFAAQQVQSSTSESWASHLSMVYQVSVSTATTYKIREICNQSNGASGATMNVANDGSTFSNGVTTAATVKAIRLP